MKRALISFKTLAIASLKMYFRNKGAVVFTLIFPMALLAVFGFLSKSGGSSVKINVTNYADSELSRSFVDAMKNIPTFKIQEVSESTASDALGKGNIDLQVIIPKDFGTVNPQANPSIAPAAVETRYNEGKPQNGQAANLILSQVATGFNNKITNAPQIITVASKGVKTNNLGIFDFFLPGILAMSIMQLGIFGTAFAFVSLKASGALRRIQATPIHPRNFLVAQSITRLVVTLLAMGILIAFGAQFFDFHMLGNYFSFFVVIILGTLVFLGFGLAVAGWAKDENQVAPVANLIQLPMLLLSGVFFSRESFPTWLKTVTDYFPLTYLADGMRHIANEGYSLIQIRGDLLGLVIWGIVVYIIAVLVFRWE